MLAAAYREGTRTIVATPHMFRDPYNNRDILEVYNGFARLVSFLKEASQSPHGSFLARLQVCLGSENYPCPEFLAALERQCVLTLNGSRYVLVELPPLLPLGHFQAIIERCFQVGYVPVIARPEANVSIQKHPSWLRAFVEQGCLVQVNTSSLLPSSRWMVRRAVFSLLEAGLVHCISSNLHSPHDPRFSLGSAYRLLQERFPATKIRHWLVSNGRAIVENGELGSLQTPARATA